MLTHKAHSKPARGVKASQQAKSAHKPRAEATKRKSAREQESIVSIIAQWEREKPDLDPGPMALFGALARAYLLTSPVIEALMAKYGLARGTFDVLAALRRSGEPYRLPPGQLSRSLMLSGAGMTNRLDRLEAMRLIARIPEPSDRRSIQIQLTAKGRHLVEKVTPQLVEFERQMVVGFGDENVKQLTQLLIAFNLRLAERQ